MARRRYQKGSIRKRGKRRPVWELAVVGGLHRSRWKAGPETGINDPWFRVRNHAAAGPQARRRTSPPAECRQDYTLVEPDVPAIRGNAFHPEFSADTENLNTGTVTAKPSTLTFCLHSGMRGYAKSGISMCSVLFYRKWKRVSAGKSALTFAI